jgi:hypothetical protein
LKEEIVCCKETSGRRHLNRRWSGSFKMRNILAKLPRLMQAKMKGLVQQVSLAR